jgi:hypothetical protein
MTLVDRTNKEAAFIDIAIPLTYNLLATITEKRNYQELAFEIRQQWQLNKITVIPLVLSATEVIPKMLNRSLTNLNLPPHLLSQVQTVAIINTCSTVRKSSMMKYTCMMKRLAIHNHLSLLGIRLSTLISILSDARPQQVLGSKPLLWELDNSGHSLR